MALYAIGDLHLSLDGKKSMEVFGGRWMDYINKIEQGFSLLSDDDVCVLCGDLTWGVSLEDALEDFRFLSRLPGRKIILKGNHDYWWSTAAKAYRFFEEHDLAGFEILNNNCILYGDYAWGMIPILIMLAWAVNRGFTRPLNAWLRRHRPAA